MKKFLSYILSFIIILIIAAAVLVPAVNIALKNENIRHSLFNQLAAVFSGEISTSSLAVSLNRSTLDIQSSRLQGALLQDTLHISIPELRIKIRYTDLLKGSFFPYIVQADSPTLDYRPIREKNSAQKNPANWGKEANTMLESVLGHGSQINISDANITLPSISFSSLSLKSSGTILNTQVSFSTSTTYDNKTFPLQIDGYTNNQFGKPFNYSFTLKAEKIPFTIIPAVENFYFTGGTANFFGQLTGKRQKISVSGQFNIADLNMSVAWVSDNKEFHLIKPYTLKNALLDIQGSLVKRQFHFPYLDLQNDAFKIKGSLLLNFENFLDPYFDLRLQSETMELATLKMMLPDPLINDWTTLNIFPRLENGTAQMESLVIRGTFNEISRIDEHQYARCLSWSGILKNVDTFYNEHKYLGKVLTTRLSMDGDVLKISDMVATSGSNRLHNGNMILADLYDPTMHLSLDIEGLFSSAWLHQMTQAGLIGDDLQQLISPVQSISGELKGSVRLGIGIGEEMELLSMEGKGTAGPTQIVIKNFSLPLHLRSCKFKLKYPGTCIIKANGLCGKSNFDGILNLFDIDRKQHLQLSIQPDISEIKNFFSANKDLQNMAPCIQNLPVQADITLYKSAITARGNLNFSQLTAKEDKAECAQIIADNPLKKITYATTLTGNKWRVKNVFLYTSDGAMQFSGIIHARKDTPIFITDLQVASTDFPLTASNILLSEPSDLLSGSINGDLHSNKLWLDSIWQDLQGHLTLTGWGGKFSSPEITINNADFDISINNTKVTVTGKNIWFKDFNVNSPLQLRADLQKYNTWNGTVRVHTRDLDLTTFPNIIRRKNGPSTNHKLPIGKLNILFGADNTVYQDLVFSPFYMKGQITEDNFWVSQFIAQLGESFIWLTGKKNGNNLVYQSYFKIIKQPVKALLDLFGFEKDLITGSLDLEGKLTASIENNETIFENLSGPLYLEIKDGILKSSSLMIKILDLITLENIFEKKYILEWKDSFKYNYIQSRLDLSGGMIGTKTFIIDAPVFDFFAEGTVDILNDSINMSAKFAPFGTVSTIVSAIPYLGYVFTGKTKSLFDFSLSIKGNLEDPEIRYVPLIGTIESLTGYIKRLVTSREEIHKDINNRLEEDLYRRNAFIKYMQQELSNL